MRHTAPTASSTLSRRSSRKRATRGVSMAGLALAWLLALPEITAVVVGPGRAEHLAPAARRSRSSSHPPTRSPDGGLLVSVLVLSEHDVAQLLDMESCIAAMEGVLARLARDELHDPLRFVMRPRAATRADGFHAAHYRGGGNPLFSLKEIVIAPGEPGPRSRPAPGRRAASRRRDGRAHGDPQRLAGDRDPHRGRIGRRDAAARPARGRSCRRPGLRRAGSVPCRGDADGARRPRDQDLEPDTRSRRSARTGDRAFARRRPSEEAFAGADVVCTRTSAREPCCPSTCSPRGPT